MRTNERNAGGASVDADVREIVIGLVEASCSASRAVDESSLVVADYLLGQSEIQEFSLS